MPRIKYWYYWIIFDQSKKEEFWIPFFQPDIWWMIIRPSMWTKYHRLNQVLSTNISKINNEWRVKMNCRKEEFSIPKLKYKNLKFRFLIWVRREKSSYGFWNKEMMFSHSEAGRFSNWRAWSLRSASTIKVDPPVSR